MAIQLCQLRDPNKHLSRDIFKLTYVCKKPLKMMLSDTNSLPLEELGIFAEHDSFCEKRPSTVFFVTFKTVKFYPLKALNSSQTK